MNNEITIDGVTYIRKDKCSCPFMDKDNTDVDKKYCFTGKAILDKGHILHRIVALKDFGDVKKGEKGGWIEKEENLSQDGDCWVYGTAKVFDNAEVRDNAKVHGNAWVYGDAKVYWDAEVSDNAKVFEDAIVSGDAKVYGDAWVCGKAKVYSKAVLCGEAMVC